MQSTKSAARPAPRRRFAVWRRRGWTFWLFVAIAVPLLVFAGITGYYYGVFSRMIDARLHGQFDRADPRVFARPLSIRRGQRLTEQQLVDRFNELGYTERPRAEDGGQFAIGRDAVAVVPRGGDFAGQTVRIVFAPSPKKLKPGATPPGLVQAIDIVGSRQKTDSVSMDAPLITALALNREKRRDVPLGAMSPRAVQAVVSIEDRRFYDHPGVDVIGTTRAVVMDLFGSQKYVGGGSTITQQLVRNTFLASMWGLDQAREKKGLAGAKRKFTEWLMSIALERRLSKDKILELYLNDVPLGQRGSFGIHGVPEASRLFFGKDVSNVSLAEAATIAAVIQAPSYYSPFEHADRVKDRRDLVLKKMADAGYVTPEAADRAIAEPVTTVARALESEAPYFVDFVSQELQDTTKVTGAVDVYTTLDLQLQRLAQDAVRDGIVRIDAILAKRRKRVAQAALIAVDPRTGEILAMVGGRSYNQSQYNRATSARRQPGSVFKPFVYLAAFERAVADGRTDVTPATIVDDEPTSFTFNDQVWTPSNYDNEYDGPITLRRALAHSRNVATIKVAESTGYDYVANFWKRLGIGTPPRPYPSIALGVFEATPLEIASAYTIFTNQGSVRPLRALSRIVSGGKDVPLDPPVVKPIARKETTFLVTNMMRSVLNEGTAASARATFTLDAAGKTGTTNDLRDAWFVGFTPELLTVVWVGLDDNQVLGLSGSQAALPIWTQFMSRALAGHPSLAFDVPPGIVFVDIDRDTGKVATPNCPNVYQEAFIAGTEPTELCAIH